MKDVESNCEVRWSNCNKFTRRHKVFVTEVPPSIFLIQSILLPVAFNLIWTDLQVHSYHALFIQHFSVLS